MDITISDPNEKPLYTIRDEVFINQNILNHRLNSSYSNNIKTEVKCFLEDQNSTRKKLEDKFNERINILELSNSIKEKEILDLMFSLYKNTQEIENIKVIYKNVLSNSSKFQFNSSIKQSKSLNKELNSDLLNRSTFSSSSRKSEITCKFNKNYVNTNCKYIHATQKVSINIDTELKDFSIKDKIEKNSNDPIIQMKLLERDLTPMLNQSRKKLLEDNSLKKLNVLIKNTNNCSKQSQIVNRNSKISDSNNKSRKLENNNYHINPGNLSALKKEILTYDSKINSKSDNKRSITEKSFRVINTDINTDSKVKKPSNQSNNTNNTNSTIETSKINNHNIKKPGYKFEPKKKNLSGSSSELMCKNNNESNNEVTVLSNLLKESFKSHYSNQSSISDQFAINFRSSSENKNNICNILPSKFSTFFNNKKNSKIFTKIFEFLEKEKIKIKNLSKIIRSSFFDYEINNLNDAILLKSKQENPLFKIKITNSDIFTKKLILSEIYHKYSSNKGFKNILIILNSILKNYRVDNINQILDCDIKLTLTQIETSINNDSNIYSKYKEIIDQIKNNRDIYLCMKMFNNIKNFFNEIFLFVHDSEDEFDVLLELIREIKKLIDKGPDLEIILDNEILTHKLEILSGYNKKIK